MSCNNLSESLFYDILFVIPIMCLLWEKLEASLCVHIENQIEGLVGITFVVNMLLFLVWSVCF